MRSKKRSRQACERAPCSVLSWGGWGDGPHTLNSPAIRWHWKLKQRDQVIMLKAVTTSLPNVTQPGYSSVGRASDCRQLQQSDGPWFDSGWPDMIDAFARVGVQGLFRTILTCGHFELRSTMIEFDLRNALAQRAPSCHSIRHDIWAYIER